MSQQAPQVIDDNEDLRPVGAPPDQPGRPLPREDHGQLLPMSAPPPGPPATSVVQHTTAAQAKVDAVANVTMKAYERAGTLLLTPEESKQLAADFPDEAFHPGAAGKENLIYIEHAALRDRLTSVLGMGQWALISRSRWAEHFTTQGRNNEPGKPGVRIYVEAMLVVRGCFVAEAIGDMDYYPHNAAQNYADAAEGALTAAFRRCAKQFGVGLQAWRKDWTNGWWERKRGIKKPAPTATPPPAPKPPPAAKPKQATTIPAATPETRQKLIESLTQMGMGGLAVEYFQKLQNPAALMPNEDLNDLPLHFVPTTQKQFEALKEAITDFGNGAEARHAFHPAAASPSAAPQQPGPGNTPPGAQAAPSPSKPVEVPRDPEPAGTGEEWREFVMPFGAHKDEALGQLDKKYLFGLWANFKVETEYKGRPRPADKIDQDQQLREALDAAGSEYKFEKKD